MTHAMTLTLQPLLGVVWTLREGSHLTLYTAFRDTSSPAHVEVWTSRAVRVITLLLHASPEAWISSINWDAFCRIAATFPYLERLTVFVVKENTEQFAAYMLHAHHHLKSLSQARGIPLDILDFPAYIAPVSPAESVAVTSS